MLMLRRLLGLAGAVALSAAAALAGEAEWMLQINKGSPIGPVATSPANGGRIVIGGSFMISPGPTIGSIGPLTKYSSLQNGLVFALDQAGDAIWAVALDSPIQAMVTSVKVVDETVFIAGGFQNTLNIAPAPQLVGAGGSGRSMFVVAMDLETGTFTKGIAFSCTGTSIRNEAQVAVNANGEMAVAITYSGVLTIGTFSTPDAGSDIKSAIVKLDSNWNIEWYQLVSPTGAARCTIAPVLIDDDGAIFASCLFEGSLTVDSLQLTTRSSFDNAFMKLDPAGTAVWLTSVSSTVMISCEGFAMNTATKDIFATCSYAGTSAQLGSGADAITTTLSGPAASSDNFGYYMKLSGGGVPEYLKGITVGPDPASTSNQRYVYFAQNGLAFDPATNSLWATFYYSAGDLTYAGETYTTFNVNGGTIFLMQFAAATGAEIYGTQYLSEGPSYMGQSFSYGLALDSRGYPIITGEFGGTLVAPPAQTLTHTYDNVYYAPMVIGTLVPMNPIVTTLPLRLKSLFFKDKTPLHGSHRALLGHKNATLAKMQKDSWSFKASMNITEAPTTPIDINTNGITFALVTAQGTVLDSVTYAASDCRHKVAKNATSRIECRAKGTPGKLSLLRQHRKAGSGTYTVEGTCKRRALNGATAVAEAPLGVLIAVPQGAEFGGVMPVGACKVARNQRIVNCKQAI